MEPSVELAPPDSPLPAPRGITGMLWELANARTVDTSSLFFATNTTAGG